MANHPALLRYHFTDEQLEDMAKRLASDPTYKETNHEYIIQDLAVMSDYQIHQLGSTHKVRGLYYLISYAAGTVWTTRVWFLIAI